jgi:hypothetical protein
MASLKQIQANRRNAQKSTGPRTAEGKAVSRFNALKTGIDAETHVVLPFEDPKDLEDLTVEYYDRFAPDTPEQRCLVDALISDEWSLRRFRVAESQAIAEERESWTGTKRNFGKSYEIKEKFLLRLQRRIDSTRRSYLRTLDILRKLQADPPRERPRTVLPAAAQPVAEQPLAPAIGFVPSISFNPPAPAPECPSEPSLSRLADPTGVPRQSPPSLYTTL